MTLKKLNELLFTAISYIKYLLLARYRKGHGIHSPYLFDLVNSVIYNSNNYEEYSLFKKIEKQLKNTNEKISVEEFGAGSHKFIGMQRKISDLKSVSSVNKKFGKLLFRLANYYKPNYIVEMGTSIGLSTIYLAKGNSQSKVITIEGNSSLCAFTRRLFQQYCLQNIEIIEGEFDEHLSNVISGISNHSIIFIDGNHSYGPTLKYFDTVCGHIDEGIIIIDDINWSQSMRKAWQDIKNDPRTNVTIDLFFMGIIIRNKNITPGNYKMRF